MTGRRRRLRGIGTERDMNGSNVTDSYNYRDRAINLLTGKRAGL